MANLKSGKLTPKQENFAQLFVELGNATDAYLKAYDCSPTIKRTTAARKASELLENNKVLKRVENIRGKLSAKMMYSKEEILTELMNIVKDYREFKDIAMSIDPTDPDLRSHVYILSGLAKSSDAVAALKAISSMLGFDKEQKAETINNIQINVIKPEDKKD